MVMEVYACLILILYLFLVFIVYFSDGMARDVCACLVFIFYFWTDFCWGNEGEVKELIFIFTGLTKLLQPYDPTWPLWVRLGGFQICHGIMGWEFLNLRMSGWVEKYPKPDPSTPLNSLCLYYIFFFQQWFNIHHKWWWILNLYLYGK